MPLITETADQYHAAPGYSKSFLWAMQGKTPYMARYGKRKESNAFDVGHAAHTAILEPELLESSVTKGPDDRRGNKWTFAKEEADNAGKILLTSSDYDQVLLIRDLADTVPELVQMRKGALIEQSCYAVDEETGLTIKCRPDLYNPGLSGMLDIKNMADISDRAWERDIGSFGYHMQDAMYRDVWQRGSDMKAEFFFFVCFSKTEPPEVVCRELESVDAGEGYLAYREQLLRVAECESSGVWPGQPAGVVRGVRMRDRDRRHTAPQWREPVEGDDDLATD